MCNSFSKPKAEHFLIAATRRDATLINRVSFKSDIVCRLLAVYRSLAPQPLHTVLVCSCSWINTRLALREKTACQQSNRLLR